MLRKAFLASLAVLALSSVSHAQTAIRAWEFNGNLNDTLGNAAITGNGGSVGASLYTFGEGQGLTVPSDTTIAGAYSLETFFQFDTTSGYRRLVDWLAATSDNGLYVLDGRVDYFQSGPNSSGIVFADNTLAHLVVTRTATNDLSIYVNGALALAFTPTDTTAINGTDTRLFQDDNVVVEEHSAGTVDYVRIYDDVLTEFQVRTLFENRSNPFGGSVTAPEPGTLALFGLGIAPLAVAIRRRKRA